MTAAIQKHEAQNKKSEEKQKWEHCEKKRGSTTQCTTTAWEKREKEKEKKKRLISAHLQTRFLGIQGQSEYAPQFNLSF